MGYNSKDYYTKKAKDENYAARSVFKLQEMDQKFKIFKPGQKILDLGAAPGSWSQYASKKIGSNGFLLGLDLTPITLKLPNCVFVQANILEYNMDTLTAAAADAKAQRKLTGVTADATAQRKLTGVTGDAAFDVVMSDMAPKTTGIKLTDQARSLELCEMALTVADKYLDSNGIFICKLFHSEDFKQYQAQLKERFKKVNVIKPKATRQISKEIFFVALSKK